MADLIHINGLRVVARHGVLPEEQERAQPFQIDVTISADIARAGLSDELIDTIDYGAVAEAIVTQATLESHALIERLAQSVADVCLSFAQVISVEVTVTKLRPPVPVDVQSTAVTIVRP